MAWYKRKQEGIQTSTSEKKEAPEGVWHQCTKCHHKTTVKEIAENLFVCTSCGNHERIGSHAYFHIIFDNGKYKEMFENIAAIDSLNFVDQKPYADRLVDARKKTGLVDAISVAHGKVHKNDFVIAAMDFDFIGGSMGSVMGEKIAKAMGCSIAELFASAEELKDINSHDKSLMEKLMLIETLSEEEKLTLFNILDAFISKKKYKDTLSGLLNDDK